MTVTSELDSTHILALRDKLKDHAFNGRLGMVAAMANVPEFVLANWCNDPAQVPSLNELFDLHDAIGESVTID